MEIQPSTANIDIVIANQIKSVDLQMQTMSAQISV